MTLVKLRCEKIVHFKLKYIVKMLKNILIQKKFD